MSKYYVQTDWIGGSEGRYIARCYTNGGGYMYEMLLKNSDGSLVTPGQVAHIGENAKYPGHKNLHRFPAEILDLVHQEVAARESAAVIKMLGKGSTYKYCQIVQIGRWDWKEGQPQIPSTGLWDIDGL